ncbi:interleukin-1 receptor-associated kinase-like 2 [Bufo bufo]|uniref:interleukin-1 receptor-associated kinase-like 2 n=1 Tax=Bufo bufo TaxID=8384 RepID=UPI001ABDBAA7|nr:interleukin-1 receptor-associated kinase-like 2 [Bufo bufo]
MQREADMAQSLSPSPFIIDISPRVLDDLCRCLDSLSDWEWMRLVSHILNDQTTIQRFYMRRRSGDYITRELLWSWGQKLATVQDLEVVLKMLELYRALEILHQNPCNLVKSPVTEESHAEPRISEGAKRNGGNCNGITEFNSQTLPLPPQPPSELLSSLWTDSYSDHVSSTDQVLTVPQQEISLSLSTMCQQWTVQQLEDATDRFSMNRKIHSGRFADVFLGRKGDNVYAIKRLKEGHTEQSDTTDSSYEKEAQIGFRCHHPNLLKLLGFCVESGRHYLVYRFMKEGSLDVALQAAPCVLGWERRLSIAASLLQGVGHLHEAGIFHGNIKSSNVFLDEHFTVKLGHAGARFCPDRSANYTNVKTYELQRFQPYLPDSYLRSGQLTAQTDVFSCGVVLAELLTGLKPVDKERDPSYLKDLILTEVEQVKLKSESVGDRAGSVDLLCAGEIGQKYADPRLERLGRRPAIHWASAVCLCLTKKRTSLSEVMTMMEKAQESFTACAPESPQEMSSVNVPEESDESLSIGYIQGDAAEPPSGTAKAAWPRSGTSVPESPYCPAQHGVSKGSPCELDESGSFDFCPADGWSETEQTSSAARPGNSRTPERNCPPTESNETSWVIEINEAKLKLMEDLELYAEEKVDSAVLFDSA